MTDLKENTNPNFSNNVETTNEPIVVVPTIVNRSCGCGKGSSVTLGPTYLEQKRLKENIKQRKLFL
jgi:hypothetical protein